MRRLALSALLFTAAALAQNPADLFNKPPAAVDQALRTRINEFYEYHVKQQFRKAEDLVAEDTKDFFYSHNKPQYLSFEIKSIQYSDNFTKAKATMICEQYVMMPGFTDRPMKVPSPSTWKIENGKWMWYIDPESLRDSPFGKMTAGKGPGGPPGLPTIPADPSFVLKQVKADKSLLTLKKGESAEVVLTNNATGMVGVSVSGEIPGIEAKLERSELKPGESAKLTVKVGEKSATEGGSLELYVSPTGETIPIQVAVKADPDSASGKKPSSGAPDPKFALKQVKLDKSQLTVKKGQSAEVIVTNNAPGTVGISVNNKIPGIDAKLARNELKAGESVKLTIKVSDKVSGGGFVAITVSPTGEILPVQVVVK